MSDGQPDGPDLAATVHGRRTAGDRWLRRGVHIAAVDLRRRVRRLVARPRSTALRALFYVGIWLWVLEPWNPRGTDPVATPGGAGELDLLAAMRGGVALAWVGLALLEAGNATTSLDDLDAGPAVVAAAGVRATLLGTQLAVHARRVAFFGVVALFGLASLVAGTGSPNVLGFGVVAVLGLTATARLAGEALGLGYAAVSSRDWLGRYRQLAMVGVVLAATVGAFRWFGTLAELVGWLPPAWYADLLLLGTPGVSPDPARAAAVGVGSLVVLPLTFLVAERLAVRVWFDPSRSAERRRVADDGAASLPLSTRLARRLYALAPVAAPTRAVAWRATVRALRQPSSLVMMGVPVFLGATLLLTSDHDHPWLPVVLAFYGAWAAGAGVTLNPLASEGPGLPALLSAPVDGRQVVAGYVLTGLALSAPLVAAVPIAAGLYVGAGAVVVAGSVAFGLLVAVAAGAVAVGVGLVLPSLEALSPTDVDGPEAPQRLAFIAYSVAVGAVALPGGAGLLVEYETVPAPAAAGPVAGLLGTALLAALLGGPAAAHAARRLDAFELSR